MITDRFYRVLSISYHLFRSFSFNCVTPIKVDVFLENLCHNWLFSGVIYIKTINYLTRKFYAEYNL